MSKGIFERVSDFVFGSSGSVSSGYVHYASQQAWEAEQMSKYIREIAAGAAALTAKVAALEAENKLLRELIARPTPEAKEGT